MGRIDDALRLNEGGAPASPHSSDGRPEFLPAWPVLAGRAGDEAPNAAAGNLVSMPTGQAPAGLVRFSSKTREKLAAGPDADPGLTEQFRRLAATLHHARQANGLNCVMVTSARPGDGKSLTAVNLSIVLADSYRYNVLLVDADLRRPSIQSIVELGDGVGLSEVLRSKTEQKLALVRLSERLTLLPAGQATANSIEALTSPRMAQIMAEATSRYDWVILDAPPVGPTTDARLLTGMVGGTLFVIHAGRTQCDDVQRAIDSLGREHLLGVVLNGVEGAPVDDYYGVAP